MRSRLVYAVPAGLAALAASALLGGAATSAATDSPPLASGSVLTSALLLLVSPALVIGLLLAKRYLIEALLLGIAIAAAIALRLGVIRPFDLLHLDRGDIRLDRHPCRRYAARRRRDHYAQRGRKF